jgi:hypothetical protein
METLKVVEHHCHAIKRKVCTLFQFHKVRWADEGCNRCHCALINEHEIYDMALVAPYASDLIGFPTGMDESFSRKTMHETPCNGMISPAKAFLLY